MKDQVIFDVQAVRISQVTYMLGNKSHIYYVCKYEFEC